MTGFFFLVCPVNFIIPGHVGRHQNVFVETLIQV